MVCKLKDKGENKKVALSYETFPQQVSVGGVSYVKNKNSPWVKKLIVKPKGFVVVSEQKTAGFKDRPCDNDPSKLCKKHVLSTYYIMQSYTKTHGYKYWFKIPKEEWASISSLEDQPSKKPDLQTNDCHFSFMTLFISHFMSGLRI